MRRVTLVRATATALLAIAVVALGSAQEQRLPPSVGKAGTTQPITDATYHEPFTGTDPADVFFGFLTIGHDPPWTGTLTGTHYRLENATAPGTAQYMYLASLPDRPDALTQGTLHVDVAVETVHDPTYGAAAGVLFNLNVDTGHYLAFVVSDLGYAIFVRDDSGLFEATSGTSDAVRLGSTNRLTVRTIGTDVQLEVNGVNVSRIDFGAPPTGAIGIIALGAGVYTFSGFTYQAP